MTAWRQAGLKWVNAFNSEKIDFTEKLCNQNMENNSWNLSTFLFSYINYSNIAARVLRQALKAEPKKEALKRDATAIRFTPWLNGKPTSKYRTKDLLQILWKKMEISLWNHFYNFYSWKVILIVIWELLRLRKSSNEFFTILCLLLFFLRQKLN